MAEVTLRDVAKLAGVHAGTASRAMDPERSALVTAATRERVLQAAAELGYRGNALARGLRTGRSGIIAVVAADFGNPFLPPMLRGVEDEINPAGFILLVAETHDRPGQLKRITDHLAARRVDAIILGAAHYDDEGFVEKLSQATPVVLAARNLPAKRHDSVVHDDVLGSRLAAQHLTDLGHTKLAQLRGPAGVSSFISRTAGFRAVIAETGTTDCSMDVTAAEPTSSEGRRLMAVLLSSRGRRDRPTAVFAHNDMMAVGALDALTERGLTCPGDISLVGYNDSPLTDHLDPPLTTVRLPSYELGRRAAQLAVAKIDGSTARPETVLLPPELVVRASTRARRRAAAPRVS